MQLVSSAQLNKAIKMFGLVFSFFFNHNLLIHRNYASFWDNKKIVIQWNPSFKTTLKIQQEWSLKRYGPWSGVHLVTWKYERRSFRKSCLESGVLSRHGGLPPGVPLH